MSKAEKKIDKYQDNARFYATYMKLEDIDYYMPISVERIVEEAVDGRADLYKGCFTEIANTLVKYERMAEE